MVLSEVKSIKTQIDFNLAETINGRLKNFVDPCGCYKIKIINKAYCNPIEKVEEYYWDGNTTPTRFTLSNISTCIDCKWHICFF